ncbi:hypothetical protein NsoK4_00460 [Nitrosopumilus sp. K4]|uniref:hypothetical protein n=1 Tax=Nitrosopumilus sp. K4 TaxID=2795383 RepID=UPI001BA7FC26|nr:hypothetical protein [Nitrosopumilus sp. K4]QUC64796.1 hypothetical protein NsoK4_00460 [Nitrosopumilus sp. K4]
MDNNHKNERIQKEVFKIYFDCLKIKPEEHALKVYCNKIKRKEITLENLRTVLQPEALNEYNERKENFDINFFEKTIYSQNGEDGIIEFIFSQIGTTNKFFVEFGVNDGTICNTRYLFEKNKWDGLMMDDLPENQPHIKKEFITAENINQLFEKYKVPKHFDLLSIDVDYNDYWVWKAITGYYPRVVIIEYNSSIPPNESKTVPYSATTKWDKNNKTNYFGASLLALKKLGFQKGYTLVGCDSRGINAFFIKNELTKGRKIEKDIKKIYRPPKYGVRINGILAGHPPSSNKMINV